MPNPTLHAFFARQPVAAAAAAPPADPDADPPPSPIFATNAERRHKVTVIKHGKPCSVYVSDACNDGTLRGGCHNVCKNQWVGIERFAPSDESSNTAAARASFLAAYSAYRVAFALHDRDGCVAARADVERLRTSKCDTCGLVHRQLTPAMRACKAFYEGLRKAACAENGGCCNPQCPERGAEAWCVLEADHGTNPKMHDAQGKPVQLSEYVHWPALGGVEAMRLEAKQIAQWPCAFCHRLEPTSAAGRRCPDPRTMPRGKARGTKEERKQYHARHIATIVYPKQQYVDANKRAVGSCKSCHRPVLPGTERGFDWNHREEWTKRKCRCLNAEGKQKGPCHGCDDKLFRREGGVCGLVQNVAKAAALEHVQPLLNEEMLPKCNLECANCHHRITWRLPPRCVPCGPVPSAAAQADSDSDAE